MEFRFIINLNYILAINWKTLASQLYKSSVSKVDCVGEYLHDLIEFLVFDLNTSYDKIHLIGHSLGAHIAGVAGSLVQNDKISRITGLDPAFPRFHLTDSNRRLNKNDAKFVDIIHTSGNSLGIFEAIGHADFYPNGGVAEQPGCSGIGELFASLCSHTRASLYYAESIMNLGAFPSISCPSWSEYLLNNCNSSDIIHMGHNALQSSNGRYYLATKTSSPFSYQYEITHL